MEADELFRFIKNTDKNLAGYAVAEYLKKDDPTVTDIEIPAEYDGLPVTAILSVGFSSAKNIRRVSIPGSVRFIAGWAFINCESLEAADLSEGIEIIGSGVFRCSGLKSVKLPKSLKKLGEGAFELCGNLESVEFGGVPSEIGARVFHGCEKLPPKLLVMSAVRSTDITKPVCKADFRENIDHFIGADCEYFHPEIYHLLAKNNCFRNCNVRYLFEKMIREDMAAKLFPIAEEHGMLSSAKLLDMLISYGIEQNKTEVTAYLLDVKNRKFGFEGGNGFDLQ